MQEKEKRGSTGLALKAGFWYVISTFLVRGLSFITTPIFSRLMSREDYGEFSNFASWQALLVIITSAELQNTVSRAYYDFKEDFDGYVSSVTTASCVVAVLFYGLFLALGDAVLNVVAIPKEFIHVLFLMLIFQPCKQIFMVRERTLYRYKSVAVISVATLLVPTVLAVVLVLLVPDSQRLSARIYGFYVPSAVIGMGCAAVLVWRGRTFRWKHCLYAFKLSLPMLLQYLAAHALTSSNTIVTKWVLGPEAVSAVSIASSTNHILTILVLAISGAITTWLMDNLEKDDQKAVRNGTFLYIAGISVVAVGMMLLAPELVWILGGSKYADSVLLMPGMVTAVLIQSVSTLFTIMLTFRKKVVKTALYTGIVTVISVVAKYFLLPRMGVQILPVINMVAFGVLAAINCLLVCRGGDERFVNFKGIVAVLGGVIAIMALCFVLYGNTVLRCSVIGVIAVAACVVLYRYRKPVIQLVKAKMGKKKKTKNTEE